MAGKAGLFENMNGTSFRQRGDRSCGAGGSTTHDVNGNRRTQLWYLKQLEWLSRSPSDHPHIENYRLHKKLVNFAF
jgi:hypothetical protein